MALRKLNCQQAIFLRVQVKLYPIFEGNVILEKTQEQINQWKMKIIMRTKAPGASNKRGNKIKLK